MLFIHCQNGNFKFIFFATVFNKILFLQLFRLFFFKNHHYYQVLYSLHTFFINLKFQHFLDKLSYPSFCFITVNLYNFLKVRLSKWLISLQSSIKPCYCVFWEVVRKINNDVYVMDLFFVNSITITTYIYFITPQMSSHKNLIAVHFSAYALTSIG